MPVTFERPPELVMSEFFNAYINEVDNAVFEIFTFYKAKMANYAKANKPWKDRTANAKKGLHSEVEHIPLKSISISIEHGIIDYGIWLEVRHAGRWAILLPTISHFQPRIMADVRKVLS